MVHGSPEVVRTIVRVERCYKTHIIEEWDWLLAVSVTKMLD